MTRRRSHTSPEDRDGLFRSLVEGVVDYAILMLDPDGKVVSWNAGAERLKGYRADEILGRHFSVFYTREAIESGEPGRLLEAAARDGRVVDENWRLRKDGTRFWANATITAMRNSAGELVGFSKVTKDRTEERALAEELLKERTLFRHFFDHSPSIVFLKDRHGRYLTVNSQFERAFALKSEAVVGRTDDEIFPSEQARQFQANDALVLRTGKANEFEETARYPDGVHTSIVLKFPLFDPAGAVYAVGGLVTDITERKQTEAMLRSTNHKLEAILQAAPLAVLTIDPSGVIMSWNKGAERTFGWKETEAIGLVCPTVPPSGLPDFLEMVRRGVAGESVAGVVRDRVRKDGMPVKASISYAPFYDVTGRTAGIVAILDDITESERSRELIQRSEEQFRSFVESAPDAVVIMDASGKIVLVNTQVEALFGYSRDEIIGRPLEVLMPHRFRDGHVKHRSGYLTAPTARPMGTHLELFGLRKDGSEFPVDISLGPLRTPEGLLVAADIRDTTERKRSELALRVSHDRLKALTHRLEQIREEEKRRIALEIHDELGQMLTALKIDLGVLLDKWRSEGEAGIGAKMRELRSAFDLADASIDTVRRIASDLRPTILEHLGLPEAVTEYVRAFEERTHLDCRTSVDLAGTTIGRSRSIAIFRVLQEALTNVARHANARQVSVTLRCDGPRLILSVEDDGGGVTGRDSGVGSFGIDGMHERAAMMQGSLTVTSEDRRGTLVRLEVPVGDEHDGSAHTGAGR